MFGDESLDWVFRAIMMQPATVGRVAYTVLYIQVGFGGSYDTYMYFDINKH